MTASLFPGASADPIVAVKGPMLGLIEAFDWSATAVGPLSSWPHALTVTTRIMLASPVPMVMLMGPKGVLVYNDAYAIFAGGRHPEVLGAEVAKGWPEIADFNERILVKVLAGETLTLRNQQLTLNRNGVMEDAWMDLDYSPVLDSDGTPIAELVIVSETTERVKAELALANSAEKLSLAIAASGSIGIWDWDIANDMVTADARFAELYGLDADLASQGTSLAAYVEGVYPEDRPVLEHAIAKAIETRGELRVEYRIRGLDGAVRWVLASGRVIADASGRAARLPGAVVDITARKAQEAALAASEAGFRALADSMPQMVWSTLPDGFHDYYNARWYEFTGVPFGSTDGEAWNGMFHPDDQERAWETWRHCLATGEPYQIEYRLRHHSGEYRWTLGRALPVRDDQGRITRWFGTCTDIHSTKLAAEEREVVAQELSHRIKNIFSVMTGIIGLSARSQPAIKPFADQLRARIAAMGKAHDLVRPHSASSRPAPGQSSLSGLIGQLVAPFQSGDSGRIRYEGDEATIDEGAATPLALLFHELATNAAKYGALSHADGTVVISGRDAGDRFTLQWSEYTPGETHAEPANGEGFGTRLIALSVQGQMGGELKRRWEPDGLKVDIDLPKAALSRTGRLRR